MRGVRLRIFSSSMRVEKGSEDYKKTEVYRHVLLKPIQCAGRERYSGMN